MTSERQSLRAPVTDEELQIPWKQKGNSAEGNSDEIYESSPGTDVTAGLGPPQPTGFTVPELCSQGIRLRLIQPKTTPGHRGNCWAGLERERDQPEVEVAQEKSRA